MYRTEHEGGLKEAASPLTAAAEPTFYFLRGKESILRMHGVLVELCSRSGQTGAMDHIALFLDSILNENKTPSVVLAARRAGADPFLLGVDDLLGAALVYEYAVLGRATGVFVTEDGAGGRTVMAAPAERSPIAIRVCEHLLGQGARIALVSYKEEVNPQRQDEEIARQVKRNGTVWGSRVRDVSTYMEIRPTFQETLAQLGRHTRRNLRYYRRRTESELGCEFYPEVRTAMSKEEFGDLNRHSTHPVEERVMARRYEDLSRFPESFCIGIRAKDGRWLSLMAGRRHHGYTEVDWQLNRAGMERLSLGTAVRSYFLENEIAFGTKRLYFEGGTPHTMRHSLVTEEAVDMVALRPSWDVRLVSRLARSRWGKNNFLLLTLADPSIRWQRL